MANPLDELEKQAEERRKGRNPGGSRNPRKPAPSPEEIAASRETERVQREERRLAEEAEAARLAKDADEARRAAEDKESETDDGGKRGKRVRPASTPFYPDPDNEEFLWSVAEAATARREKIPATAVLRLALRRLEQQMTPSEVVRELSGPVQTTGKMGRPRR